MKVIVPELIGTPTTMGSFFDTNLPYNYPVWSSSTTYAKGARVRYIYWDFESLQDGNLFNYPPASGVPLQTTPTATSWWVCVGTENRYGLFDLKVNNTATTTGSFYAKWSHYKNITSVAVLNVKAVTVRLRVLENFPVAPVAIYDVTKGLSSTPIIDWYRYFFTETTTNISQIIFENIPPGIYNVFELTATSDVGEVVSVGEIIGGYTYELGNTQYGVSAGIIDYSVKTVDAYGNVDITKRSFSKRMSSKIQIEKSKINAVQQIMYSLRATPCVWIGNEDDPDLQEPLIVLGYYKDFSTEISYPSYALMNLEIEGLI